MTSDPTYGLPPDVLARLPVPADDGRASHLEGAAIPEILLRNHRGQKINLWDELQTPSVLFIFPRAGSPLEPNTNQELWDLTPGARGCTPQTCGFRDLHGEFMRLGYRVFGLSVQTPEVLAEIASRNRLPFDLISDCEHKLLDILELPEFTHEGERLIKRMAWVIEKGVIRKVFYPVFPPDGNAATVLAFIKAK